MIKAEEKERWWPGLAGARGVPPSLAASPYVMDAHVLMIETETVCARTRRICVSVYIDRRVFLFVGGFHD